MTSVTTDLVVYENGERKVIGTAVVSADGKQMQVEGSITDEAYQAIFSQSSISVFTQPSKQQPGRSEVVEACLVVPTRVQGSADLPPNTAFAPDAQINSSQPDQE